MRRQNNFPCSFNTRKTALSCCIAAATLALSTVTFAEPVDVIIGADFTTIPPEGLKADLTLNAPNYEVSQLIAASRYKGNAENILSIGSSLTIENAVVDLGSNNGYKRITAASVEFSGSRTSSIALNLNKTTISGSTINDASNSFELTAAEVWRSSNQFSKAELDSNILEIKNSNVKVSTIAGAQVDVKATYTTVQNNQVDIDGSVVKTHMIYGAQSRPDNEGTINYINNSVSIRNSSEVTASAVAAVYSTQMNYQSAEANRNSASVDDSTLNGSIRAVSIIQSFADPSNTEASDNRLNLKNAAVGKAYAVGVETIAYGPTHNSIHLKNNSLTADNVVFNADVMGAYATSGSSRYGGNGIVEVDDTVVKLKNSTTSTNMKNFRGAWASSREGDNFIRNSQIHLESSDIKFSSEGAEGFIGALSFSTNGGSSFIEGTTINVASSKLSGTFYGAYAALSNTGSITGTTFDVSGQSTLSGDFLLAMLDGGSSSTAADNRFIVRDKSDLSDAEVWGYNITSADFTAERNQFIASNWTGSDANGTKVKAIVNFNEVLFGPIAWNENGSAITILTGKDSLAGTKIGAVDDKWIVDAAAPLESGDKMKLIDGSAVFAAEGGTLGIAADAFTNEEFDLYSLDSAAVVAKAELSLDEEGSLWITAGESGSSGQANQLLENRAAAAAYLNSTEDLIEDALASASGLNGVRGIALAQGNAMKYDTRSEVKLNGWSGLFGAAVDAAPDMTAAAFFEAGDANYRTWNDFAAGLRGDGRIEFYGLGAALKKNFGEDFSAYAGLRGGMMRSEMNRALAAPSGEVYDLSSDSWYWSAQVGAEKRFQLSDRTSLAFSGKFVHTYVEGGSEAAGADRFTFDSIDSDRLQAAVKLERGFGRMTCAWIKAGLAYELNGDSRMRVNEFSAPEQSLEGASGIFEAGGSITPESNGWRIRGIVRGYAGRIEGLAGQISAVRAF